MKTKAAQGPMKIPMRNKPIHVSEPWKHLAIGGIRYQAESEGPTKGLYNNIPRTSRSVMAYSLENLK